MKLIGREELTKDPRFAMGDDRVRNTEELDTMELQNEPTFVERGFMQTVKHHSGEYKMATWPVRVDGKSVRLKATPALGQHTAEVLDQWLGIYAGQVAALKTDGVI